jgi:hypothetical protein
LDKLPSSWDAFLCQGSEALCGLAQ